MECEGLSIHINAFTKFHHFVFLDFILKRLDGTPLTVRNLKIENPEIRDSLYEKVEDGRYNLQALSNASAVPLEGSLVIETDSSLVRASLADLFDEAHTQRIKTYYARRFEKMVSKMKNPKVLDIGGRTRSKIEHSKKFENAEVTVMDILPGPNVDIVGDAHHLSKLFKKGTFDAVYSISVFEHLLMPWKVILEMNHVMKEGGIGFISTHQSIGLHDLPWDFWRFSNSSWDALLNKYTGFEVVNRQLILANYIMPFLHTKNKDGYENSAGYELSSVIFRKTGNTRLDWPVAPKEIIQTVYPE